MDSASLLFEIFKIWIWVLGSFWVTSQWGHVYVCLAKYTWHSMPTQRAIFLAQVFSKLASNLYL